MVSATQLNPTVPEVYCQLSEQNEVLGSLMSSVFQRSVRSLRFDRYQQRQVSVLQEQQLGGAVATHHIPLGHFRSKIAIFVISQPTIDNDDAFLPHLIRIATNRGHTVIGLCESQESESSQIT